MTKKQEEVEVVMTKTEMDEYLKFKAERELADSIEVKKKDLVEVQLRFEHKINGTPYEAGRMLKVSREIAEYLVGQDQRAFDSYMAQFESKNNIVEIFSKGRSKIREVSPDHPVFK